jgi:hypothetical protein
MRSKLFGFNVYESAGIVDHTVGTGSAYTSHAAGFAVGTTSIPIISGSDTVLAGDVVTFTGDTNQYVVKTGVTAAGTLVIAEPGLRIALPATTTAMTIIPAFAANMAFDRSAIQLATRAVALPEGGDQAIDSTMITDPRTGLSFEVALYPQFLRNVLHVRLAWGTKLIKPAHCALLLG